MTDREPDYTNLKDAFRRIYEEHYASLIRFAEGYVGRRDEAEDLVQEVFTGLLERQPRFLSKAALNAWLYTAVRHAALDHLKHRDVEARYAENFLADREFARPDTRRDEEVMDIVFRAIDTLPERCREIFLMHLDGLSNEAIAAELGLSVHTVKTQKKKAMRLLRDYFGAPGRREELLCRVGWLLLLWSV